MQPERYECDTHIDEIINIPVDVKQVHVLFHFHDHYSDCKIYFTDRQEAEIEFWKKNKEQLDYFKKHWSKMHICAIQYGEENDYVSSTIYERDESQISYPHKGDQWVLVTVEVTGFHLISTGV